MPRYLLYKIGQKLAVMLPLKFAYQLAVFLADLHRLFSRGDRIAVESNLRVIFPQADKQVFKAYSRDVFRNFARYLVDFFRLEIIDKGYIENNVKIIGLDIVDNALGKAKGVVAVTAHIANWELSGVTMALLGYPIVCVALTHRDERINRFFIRQRERKGLGVVSLGQAAFRCLQALKKNKIVALVGDRDFTQAGISIDFFGKPTVIPKGPAAFSLRTGAPLVVGIILRENNGRFRFIYEGPIEIKPSGNIEEDIKELTRKYVSIFEKYIKNHPEQWLMFRRFWEPVEMDACD